MSPYRRELNTVRCRTGNGFKIRVPVPSCTLRRRVDSGEVPLLLQSGSIGARIRVPPVAAHRHRNQLKGLIDIDDMKGLPREDLFGTYSHHTGGQFLINDCMLIRLKGGFGARSITVTRVWKPTFVPWKILD